MKQMSSKSAGLKVALLALSGLAFGATAASATPLNTGYDVFGNLVTLGTASPDAAWVGTDTTAVSEDTALPTYTANAAADYPGAWLTPPANALWVTPIANAAGGATDYASPTDHFITWTQTFSLTANEAASDILGVFAADNAVTELLVNGVDVFNTPGGTRGYNFFTNFDIPVADLHEGSGNTISFVTLNQAYSGPNPTGLLVEFTQIPEPASLAILIIGLGALSVQSRRRRA